MQQGTRGDSLHFVSAISSARCASSLRTCSRASGFDARRDIAGIILNRWGHHFIVAQPGFVYGKDGKPAPADVLRKAPFGRIAFANTDLTGDSGHDLAIEEGHRAVMQLLAL